MTTKWDDIPGDGGRPPVPTTRKLSSYQRMLKQDASRLNYNAYVYSNQRASKDWTSLQLKKVLIGARFVPAHASRFEIGAVFFPRYFIVHRPGSNPKASTLLNTIREFSWPHRKAATHFIIGLQGELIQMVDLADIAYHCGTSRTPNSWDSVGAELEGAVGAPFTQPQLSKLADVLAMLRDAYGLPLDRTHILGHSEIMSKKQDPGPNFPYEAVIASAKRVPKRTTVYQPAFDLRNTIQDAAAEVLLAASESHSRETRALLTTASGEMNARMRATMMRYSGRAEIASAAAIHNSRLLAGLDMNLAYKLHAEDIFEGAVPTPQTNVTGLLFNFDTGKWNDA